MTEGRTIAGRYQLLSKLGQGGMGSVYRAVHLELGTPVAVKLIDLDPTVALSKTALARFKREAQATASIRSNHVVQILDYGVDGETPYIVMELLEGENLAARISRQGVLPAATVSNIMGQVGKALERAHAVNIVHRDLKPDNIFLLPDGDEVVAKVLDFGIAKTQTSAIFDATIQTKSGAILGTPHYMSPEQASGRGTIDPRTDIWALGVIVFECFTGFRPFTGATLGGLVLSICSEPIPRPSDRGSVPRGLDAWFGRAVCREKDRRFSTINAAIVSLKQVCEPADGSVLAFSSGGLRREKTTIVGDDSNGTVSPSSNTLGSVKGRRSYVTWGLVATFVCALAATTIAGRSWLRGVSTVSSTLPSLASSAATNAPTDSVIAVRVASASPVTQHAGPPSTPAVLLTVTAVSTVLPRPSNKAGKSVSKPTVVPPLAATTEASASVVVTPPSATVEAPRPMKSTQPIRNAEERLAF